MVQTWRLLFDHDRSMYQQDISVQDFDGVKVLPGGSNWDWTSTAGVRRPSELFCLTFQAWEALIKAAATVGTATMTEPLRYDLVDLGRDVLARLTTPISQEFMSVASLGNGSNVATYSLQSPWMIPTAAVS